MPEDYYRLGCFVIVVLMFFFVRSTFSVLRWRFLFSTSTDEAPREENKNKCIILGELRKTFENKGFLLSETATCKKKIWIADIWEIKDKRKIYCLKKEKGELHICKDELSLFDIRAKVSSNIKQDYKVLIGSLGSLNPIIVGFSLVIILCVLFFIVPSPPANPLTLWDNAEDYQRGCFVTVLMVYAIFFIPFYFVEHLRIWTNITILLITIFVAFLSLCKWWGCFNEPDAFFWVFSTLAQVFGALLALLAISVFFFSDRRSSVQRNKKSETEKNGGSLYSTSKAAMISLRCIAAVLFYSIIILAFSNFFSVYSEIGMITIIIFGVELPIFAITSLIPLIVQVQTLFKSETDVHNDTKKND